jgi:hypothetical protein
MFDLFRKLRRPLAGFACSNVPGVARILRPPVSGTAAAPVQMLTFPSYKGTQIQLRIVSSLLIMLRMSYLVIAALAMFWCVESRHMLKIGHQTMFIYLHSFIKLDYAMATAIAAPVLQHRVSGRMAVSGRR